MSAPMCRAAMRRSALSRAARPSPRTSTSHTTLRHISSFPEPRGPPPRTSRTPIIIGLTLAGSFILATAGWTVYTMFGDNAVAGIPQAEFEFEKKRKVPKSKEENRDLMSSQHVQIRKSWENPGVYAWGSNTGRVAAPDSKEVVVKTPRRIEWFNGMLLRDVKIDQRFGCAVTEHGDLVQWGTGYSTEDPQPTYTLKGKNIVKLAISRDRILALSSGGSVYSLPVAKEDQLSGIKPEEGSSWLTFWSKPSSPISYRQLKPNNLGWGEKVIDISSGLEHSLLLTSSSRVFSAASSSESFPSKGQLGIPDLTWFTRPQGPYDQPHEIGTLKGFKVKKIATGDYHSLVLDDKGRVFAFGDNSAGQLGFPIVANSPVLDSPKPLPLDKLYEGTDLAHKVTSIAAGGSNSYLTIDATRIPSQAPTTDNLAPARALGKIVADTWAAGEGIYGSLGTGKWTHLSNGLNKVKALSGLFEWDEKTNQAIPIRLSYLSVGSTHTAAVMDNATYLNASGKKNENETNWGADIMWWGGNEFYQLGNGKRSNSNTPVYIGPLDGGADNAKAGRQAEQYRFQITPRQTVRLGEGGKGRKVSVEQRVECGRYVTAVYSGV